MRSIKLFLAVIAAALSLTLAAAPSFAVDVNAGPIWNNDDAQTKCPQVCGGRANWDGNWRTTEFGRNSVCACRAAAGAPQQSFSGAQSVGFSSTCNSPSAGACRSCSAYCAEGLSAQCSVGRPVGNSCAAPASCTCR
jgi:hypothetical protein